MASRTGSKDLPASPTYSNAILIFNPNAGKLRRHPGLIGEVLRVLAGQGHRVAPRPTAGPQDATALAAAGLAEGADLVLAAGGDGTINEVVNGMAGSAVPLAIVPAGTANVLAMEMHIGGNAVKAVRRLPEWEPVRIPLGLVCNMDGSLRRYFLAMAGAGFDARIVATVDSGLKNRLGKGAYWIAGFQSLGRKLEELEVEIGGRRTRCSFALTSRVRNYGGDLEIARGASLLRPGFESVLFSGSSAWSYFPYLFAVLTGATARVRGITITAADRMVLHPANGNAVRLQLDGEEAGELPARLELVPDGITLLMPPAFLRTERARWTT